MIIEELLPLPKRTRGRPKATEISVNSKKQISSMVARFHIKTPVLTYRDLQTALTKKTDFEFSLGTIYNLAHGKEPKSLHIRRAFGLSPICPSCHRKVSRPVTVNQLMQLPLQKMPPEILRLAYENRKEVI